MSEYRPGPASLHTRLVFERARTELPFCDRQDQADARRGLLAPLPETDGERPPGAAPAPASATHPSLLRISELRRVTGVFEVVPGVHQVRGLGDRNLTLVDSRHGRVLVDGPRRLDLARAAVALVDEHAGRRPVVARLRPGAQTGTVAVDGLVVDSVRVRDDAVAEVLHWFPAHGLLYAAASAPHSLPVLVSQGRSRDPVAWSQALHEVLAAHRDLLAVTAGAQDWPTWGNARVRQLLADQRDLLRYVHDEVLRLGHRGHPPEEVADLLRLPPALAVKWHARGYDSTLEAHVHLLHPGGGDPGEPGGPEPALWRMPVSPAAAGRFLGWAGGPSGAAARLRTAYAEGDYRWVAQAGELAVVAEPEADDLRRLTARAYEQLAYQEENLGRRRAFAERARRLTVGHGEARRPTTHCVAGQGVDGLLGHLGLRLDGPRAAPHALRLRWSLPDADAAYLLEVHNGALFTARDDDTPVEATITSSHAALAALACDHLGWHGAVRGASARVDGDLRTIELFFGLLDRWPCPHSPRLVSTPSLQEDP